MTDDTQARLDAIRASIEDSGQAGWFVEEVEWALAELERVTAALRELHGSVEGARWQIEDYLGAPMAEGPLGCFWNLDLASLAAAAALAGGARADQEDAHA